MRRREDDFGSRSFGRRGFRYLGNLFLRAEGIAKANKIIGDSLQNNDAYIHYLWVEALRETKNAVVYVPTEAGIPITEATRFADKP